MQTMTVGELKSHFSEVLTKVEAGEKIAISFGRKKEIKAYLVPNLDHIKPRILGVGSAKGKVIFKDDFKMTDNELISL